MYFYRCAWSLLEKLKHQIPLSLFYWFDCCIIKLYMQFVLECCGVFQRITYNVRKYVLDEETLLRGNVTHAIYENTLYGNNNCIIIVDSEKGGETICYYPEICLVLRWFDSIRETLKCEHSFCLSGNQR